MKKKPLCLVITTLLYAVTFSQVCIPQATLSSPLTYNNNAPSLISGLRISNSNGSCLVLNNCHNITITNCILGASSAPAIVLEGCTNITITNCLFKDMNNGVYALTSQGIKVNYNQFVNVQYGLPRGQFVQFNNVSGSGNEVMYNVGENIPGNSGSEDLVSMYQSNGTSTSPILIKGNKFRGGGPSTSGGGIMTGDDGGSYIAVEDNILVDPGQYGIAIASGTNIRVVNNKIYGRQQPFTNVGIYIWNQYQQTCSMNTVENNQVNYTNKDEVSSGGWDGGNCGPVTGWNSNVWNATFTDTILPQRLLCPELAAYYKFNNSWSDQTGNNLTATSNGPYMLASCDGDQATARFSGTSGQMVTLRRSAGLRPSLQKISVSCWIKPTSVTGIKGIVRGQDGNGWDNSWRMIINNGVFNPRITTDQGSAEVYYSGIQPDTWAHVVMTYDGRQLKGYVNGVLQGTANLNGNILYYPSIQESMRIGFTNGDYYFNGEIDEFRFYAGDLTAAEVTGLYDLHKDIFNDPVNPVISSVEYYNNGQLQESIGSNVVTSGYTHIYINSPDEIAWYSWDVISGNPNLISYGSNASITMADGQSTAIMVTAFTPCSTSVMSYMEFYAYGSLFTSTYSRASQEIIVNQVMPKAIIQGGKRNAIVKPGFKLEVFNTAGQLIKQAMTSQTQLRLNTAGLREGLYIIHVTGNGIKQVKKVMITR